MAPTSGWQKVGVDLFAGTCGGVSLVAVGHPLDTVKVRLQSQPAHAPIYSGLVDCIRKTIQWEGFAGLYRGVTSPLTGQMFLRANLFAAFGASKRWLGTRPDGAPRMLTPGDFYKAGAMTGVAMAITETPIDLYKSQMQVQIVRSKADPSYMPPYARVSDAVRASFRLNGLRGPFQGLTATMMRNCLALSVNLGSFENMKRMYCQRYGCAPTDIPPSVVLAFGTLGGFCNPLVNFPCDQIKTAMMTDSMVKSERRYPTVALAARTLWAEGGVRRYYNGFLPCILRLGPAYGVMQLTVDLVTRSINRVLDP